VDFLYLIDQIELDAERSETSWFFFAAFPIYAHFIVLYNTFSINISMAEMLQLLLATAI